MEHTASPCGRQPQAFSSTRADAEQHLELVLILLQTQFLDHTMRRIDQYAVMRCNPDVAFIPEHKFEDLHEVILNLLPPLKGYVRRLLVNALAPPEVGPVRHQRLHIVFRAAHVRLQHNANVGKVLLDGLENI